MQTDDAATMPETARRTVACESPSGNGLGLGLGLSIACSPSQPIPGFRLSVSRPTEAMERRLNVNPHDKPLVPDEDSPDLGFLYARSLSLYADEESNATNVNVRSRSLRNRVLGQTWCSAVVCPVSAALTLANNTGRHSSRTSG